MDGTDGMTDMTVSFGTKAAETRNHMCGSEWRRVGPKAGLLMPYPDLYLTGMHVKRLRETF